MSIFSSPKQISLSKIFTTDESASDPNATWFSHKWWCRNSWVVTGTNNTKVDVSLYNLQVAVAPAHSNGKPFTPNGLSGDENKTCTAFGNGAEVEALAYIYKKDGNTYTSYNGTTITKDNYKSKYVAKFTCSIPSIKTYNTMSPHNNGSNSNTTPFGHPTSSSNSKELKWKYYYDNRFDDDVKHTIPVIKSDEYFDDRKSLKYYKDNDDGTRSPDSEDDWGNVGKFGNSNGQPLWRSYKTFDINVPENAIADLFKTDANGNKALIVPPGYTCRLVFRITRWLGVNTSAYKVVDGQHIIFSDGDYRAAARRFTADNTLINAYITAVKEGIEFDKFSGSGERDVVGLLLTISKTAYSPFIPVTEPPKDDQPPEPEPAPPSDIEGNKDWVWVYHINGVNGNTRPTGWYLERKVFMRKNNKWKIYNG
jgi:hypothetical protein